MKQKDRNVTAPPTPSPRRRRPQITTTTDNGQSSTEVNTYTAQSDPKSESFGSAGGTTVSNWYYPTSGYGSTGTADGLQTLTVATPSQAVTQGYTYNGSSKRPQTITINGITLTYNYLSNSNQISSITAGGVTTTFTPDSADPARLGGISVTASGQSVYSAAITYSQNDQQASDVVTRTNVANDGTTSTESSTIGYGYDPNRADALTSATDTSSVSGNSYSDSYSYDGVGNRVGTSLGSANSVNEYSNLTYNQRGDETDDGTNSYSWDAMNQMIGVTPDHPSAGSIQEKMGYDSQSRMLWENFYAWINNSWQYSYSHHFVWAGKDLVAETDGNNTLLENFTWGPGSAGSDTLLAITDDTLSTPKTDVAIEDASGSVVALVNPLTDQVDASYHYGPFGENFTSSGPEANLSPFGYRTRVDRRNSSRSCHGRRER